MDVNTVERLIKDKKFFIENVLLVEDKSGKRIPFTLKPIQADMLATMTGRDIYLKPAQVGSTTLIMADFYHDCITKPGTNSVVVAHEEFITQRLLKKVHFFNNTVPSVFPKPHHKSSYELTWPDLNSSFYIGTARSYVFGRGETIHNLCCSEYAFWPDTERILAPALERVPPEGKIIVESTPNGENNEFNDLFTSAKERTLVGTSRFTPHFYTWNLEPDYQLPPDSPYALPVDRITPLDYTEEERDVIRKLGCSEAQIRWRRMKIGELEQLRRDGSSVRLFAQEFPEDDVSCFLATGDMVYDADIVSEKMQKCYKAPISLDGFRLWREPQRDMRYMVSIDPGMGKITKSVVQVWRFWWEKDIEYGEHCATLSGLYAPEITAEKAIAIARAYNKAMIAVEANGHGLAVLTNLRSYGNLYKRKNLNTNSSGSELGWLTTKTSKPFMVRELAKMLPRLEVNDVDIVSELRNMRYSGDIIKSVGSDDLHDAAAIAVACRRDKIATKGFVGSHGWKW